MLEGRGKHLRYNMIKRVREMCTLVLQGGGGGIGPNFGYVIYEWPLRDSFL